MAKYRILSLDGGGLRGLISARILQKLCDDPASAGWLDKVDLIAGTSTGGLLALGLASGQSPKDMCDVYINDGAAIFDDNIWDNIRDLGSMVGASYSNRGLEGVVNKIFGSTTLSDLNKKVAVPAFDLDNMDSDDKKRTWKPKIFHNFTGQHNDEGVLAGKVALYTSAAPTYFPSVDGFIDGGVFANNPSMVAIAQAISSRNISAERAQLDEIVLLSVGTGVSAKFIEGKNLDWGTGQWIKPLIDILMDGVAGISDYQSSQLLGDRYRRIQLHFAPDEAIDLDDLSKLSKIDTLGKECDLRSSVQWLTTHWL